jgi:hypothetical protein
MVKTYNILERYACAETKRCVYEGIGQELPRELTDMVLEYVLLAKELPEKPGEHKETFVRCGADAYIRDDSQGEGSSSSETEGDDAYDDDIWCTLSDE